MLQLLQLMCEKINWPESGFIQILGILDST